MALSETRFETVLAADWRQIRAFWETGRSGPDPQAELANKYFEIYLSERAASPLARKALEQALVMWSNQRGTSVTVDEALARIGPDRDDWDVVVGRSPVRNSYCNDGRAKEYVVLLRSLLDRVRLPRSRAAIQIVIGKLYLDGEEDGEALPYFMEAAACDELGEDQKAEVDRSLYELRSLQPGQPAPDFEAVELGNERVRTASRRGRVLTLHFWDSGCEPCKPVYSYLTQVHRHFQRTVVSLIGVSCDTNVEVARQAVVEHGLTWPNVCDGLGFQSHPFVLYNVRAIPCIYVIDPRGRIRRKLRGSKQAEELMSAVHELATGDSD